MDARSFQSRFLRMGLQRRLRRLGRMLTPRPKIPKFPQSLPGTFWAVVPYFNPAEYQNKLKNLERFSARVRKQGIRLLIVDLLFADDGPRVPDEMADRVVRRHSSTILWHKERLLNIGLAHLPGDCDKVAWLDGDVLFENNQWVTETASRLESYQIVQPYDEACWLPQGIDWAPRRAFTRGTSDGQSLPGFGSVIAREGARPELLQDYMRHGHTGFAWAARRALLDKHRFYDRQILGCADLLMAHSMCGGGLGPWFHGVFSPALVDHYGKWASAFYASVQGSVYFTPGRVLHLWHGRPENRQYQERLGILRQQDFDPESDVTVDGQGCLAWSSAKPSLHEWAEQYFQTRCEDG